MKHPANSWRKLLIAVVVLALAALPLTACQGGESAASGDAPAADSGETGNAGDGNGAAAASDGDVYRLSLSTHDPATSNKTKFHQEWADRVNEASGGRLEITVYSAGSLADGTSALDAMRTGVCDIAWIYPAYFPGQFPISEVVTLPIGIDTVPQAVNVLWDLYESETALQEELAEFVPLMIHSNPVNIIASAADYPIASIADLQGLKFRASAGAASDLLMAWGATPMQMSPGDIFQAVERGTVEGYIFDYSGIVSFALQEVTANYTDMAVYLGPYYLMMNRESFDAIPEDLQQILLDHSTREVSLEMAYVYEADERSGREIVVEAGGNIISVSDAAAAEFREASQSLIDAWIAENGVDGFDAESYVEKARALADEYHIAKNALNATLDEMGF